MTQQPNQPPLPPPPLPPPPIQPPQGPYGQAPYPPGPYAGVQPLGYQTPMSPYGVAVTCPKCGDPRSKKVGYTWWGGVIGPRMLSHVKCLGCGSAYNGKTGKSNTTGILIYSGVGFAIGLLILFIWAMSRW